MSNQPATHLPVTALIATSLFFTGITFASTVNYASIVGIEALGIPNSLYAVLLMASSLVSAAASVLLGYFSDRIGDRRLLVIACALTGALGFGVIFIFRSPLAFIIAIGVIMPFGGALFSQTFAFARSYYNEVAPARAEFMSSVLRTIFAVAWAIVPPAVGWVAATSSVFNVYGIAALAYLVCAAIFVVVLRNPAARLAAPRHKAADGEPAAARAQLDPAIMAGIFGVCLIFVATQINNVAVPLLVTSTLKGGYGQLGIYAGLAAAVELPFMILWGYSLRWVKKHTIIVAAAILYALYLYLLSRAQSVADVLWLQLVNGPATAALVSIPISYMQDAIKNRVGLSTSLLDVVRVASVIASAALFGTITAAAPNYPLMFVVAAVLSVAGAAVLFAAHRIFGLRPVVTAR